MERRTRLLIVLGIVAANVIAALVLALTTPVWLLFRDPFRGRRFDPAVWHAYHASSDPDNPRARMVADLRRRHLRPGMTQAEVVSLLGEPDFDKQADFYRYRLGAWSGFRIDHDSLDVHFDSSGRLTGTAVVQH